MSGSADAGRLLVRIEATTAQLRQELQNAERAVTAASGKIDTSLKQADRAFDRMNTASAAAQQAVAGLSSRLGPLGGLLSALGPAGLAAGAAMGVMSGGLVAIAKAGDTATATLGRLQNATGSLTAARDVYESLYQASQKTGVAVAESAGAFVRFQVAAGEIGATRDQVLHLVTGLQKVGVVSGVSAQEGAAAMQQLGQALASGKLQGDELRSLMENMPQLAAALARELGTNVGQLRKMGEEGQLTADRVFPALLKATEKMSADFEKMPPTMSRSFDILGSAMLNFTGKLDEALGLSQAIARAVKAAADEVNGIRRNNLPTEREAAQDAVRSATANVANLRAAIPTDQQINSSYSSRFDQAKMRADREAAQAALRAAESELRGHQQRLAEIEKEGQADRFGQYVAAQGKAAEAAKISAKAAFDAAEAKQPLIKLEQDYLKAVQEVDAAERTGAVSAERVAAQRLAIAENYHRDHERIIKEQAGGLEKVATGHAKIAKEAAAADDHVKAYLKDQEKAADAVAKSQEKAAEAIRRYHERSFDAVLDIGERAFDRLGDSLVDVFVSGEGAAVNFGGVFRGVMASALADIGKLAIVNPLLNSLFTSSSGPRPTLSGAFGGSATSFGGGGFSIPGLGSLSSLLPSGGIAGLLSTQIINPGFGGTAVGPLAEIVGGGSGATLGGLLGGAGAGFGAGMFLNNILGGNQTGGMVGSGLGALGGAALGSIIPGIGTLIGGLIGGAAGGGLGGLIGPGPSVNSYGLRLQSTGFVENGANNFAGSLAPVSRQFYDKEGDAKFQEAEALVKAVNAYMAANGIQVAGASIIGGNKNGADGSGFFNIGDAFANLNFRSADNEKLSAYLGTQAFDDPAKLQAAVEGFKQASAAIEALGAETVPAFTASLKAVNDNFDAGVEAARKYGLAEDNLTTARAKAIDALEAQRTETLRQSDVSLAIRRAAAGGDTQQAELARQAEAARQELDAFGKSLDALAINAEDKAARIVALEEVQAAERLAIISRYGEQAATALRQAGGNIRAYLDSLATGTAAGASPTDRLAAAQANFERDRLLATGGDRDALGRITGSADALLSAGRDMYASGAGFQAIKGTVTGGLGGLPVVQSYDAMQAASLAAIQTALTTGTLNTQTVILSNGNTVQIAGGVGDMSAVTAALAVANQSLANAIGTLNTGFGGTWQGLADTIGTLNTGFAGTWKGLSDTIATLNSGLGVVATNIATHAANDNAGFGALGATLNLANTIAAQIRTDTLSARGYLSFIDNTAKALSNYAITNFQAQNAGNTIAKDASASSVAGFAGLTTVAVDAAAANSAGLAALTTVSVDGSGAAVAALNASNTIAASNANAFVAAMNANNVITADGNLRIASVNSYTSFIDNTLRAQNNYILDLRTELQGLRQQINALNASIQAGAALNATETRKGAVLIADGVNEVKIAVRDAA